jgi:HlyD family secretion protein
MPDIAKPKNAPLDDQGAQAAPPRNRRRFFLLAGVLVLVVAAAVGVWARFVSPVKVAVSHPAANVAVQVFGLGTIEARVTSQVGFKIAGVLVNLRADIGDRVAKGAVLARLDDREQRAQVARAKASVQQAEANLQRATASVEKAKANFANAKNINERRRKPPPDNHVDL